MEQKTNQETPNKRGPKPKKLTEKTVLGLPVGRAKTIVPPEEVYKLAALGCKPPEIANWFGVGEDTIRRNFARELIKGKEDLKITLRRAMMDNAVRNMHASVQIFLAKNLLGMSDTPVDSEAAAPLPWDDEL